jgi:RTX calcium-binding nonapeptide repeat (4 copies)/Calcineurin-like phosphoesterase
MLEIGGSRARPARGARLLLAAAAFVLAVVAATATSASARSALRCTVKGTANADALRGTSHRDVLCGFGGDDTIHGGGGADVIEAGPGDDVVYPGPGKDTVHGGPGNDLIFAVDGARDLVDGGPDVDRARVDSRDRRRALEGLFPAASGPNPVILAAGDIANCAVPGRQGAVRTAPLLDAYPTAPVLTLGDEAYESGTPSEFADCYDKTWGRVKARTKPTPGNHEYETPGAAGYFGYFGAAAGDPAKGYYSYDLGRWHVVSLNSNCEFIGGCEIGSPQEQWLRADLAAHPATCTLAYWHHPRFSSGKNGSDTMMQPLWQTLQDLGTDLIITGHDHDYERFAPQTATGVADPARGIRAIVVGTGGGGLSGFFTPIANSEAREATTYGILKLTLAPTSYAWQFIPEAGKPFADSGTTACH